MNRIGRIREISVRIKTPIPDWEVERLTKSIKALVEIIVLPEYIEIIEVKP